MTPLWLQKISKVLLQGHLSLGELCRIKNELAKTILCKTKLCSAPARGLHHCISNTTAREKAQSTAPQPFLTELYSDLNAVVSVTWAQHQCLHLRLLRRLSAARPAASCCQATTIASPGKRHAQAPRPTWLKFFRGTADASKNTEPPHRPTLLQGTKDCCRSNLRLGMK